MTQAPRKVRMCMGSRFSFGLLLLSLTLTGCSRLNETSSPRNRSAGWSQVHLPNVSRDAAYDAAQYSMKQWFRIDSASPKDWQIQSVTTEYDQRGGTGRLRDAAGHRNRMRRTARIYVEPEGTGSIARCMVEVQRQDTAEHRAFRDNTRFADYPTQTPIDSDASVTAEQSQVWTDMPRDRQLEMDMLNVLRSRATGQQPTSSAS